MFDKAIELFDKYFRNYDANDYSLFAVNCEIHKKLSQLNWLIHQSQILNTHIITHPIGSPVNFQYFGTLEIYTESFYHFAFRLNDLLQTQHPRFKKFEAIGVRNVRNNLIVHPEKLKEDAKLHPVFTINSLETGPKIKSYTGGNKHNNDKGLYINAKEFADELEKVFQSALNELIEATSEV